MKAIQYIQTLMFTLAAASSMTKEQMMKSHKTITCEEPCFGLSPADKRTRASMLAAFQRQIAWMVDFDHGTALAMNAEIDAQRVEVGLWNRADIDTEEAMTSVHAEALEINAQVDAELCKLARVIAGVNRSTYKHETKAELIGAACAGVVDGLRERVGVVLSRDRLAETVTRAVVARNE
ncbi:hypothetical protein I5421_05970 [Citrobacter braakii]|nr:hypothetical protein [Citrobacter braakii]MBJ8901139.1 hypothetical protein [Citrobacter braakii]MBJ8905794.1 hypothetical protein [Citrobacter braakii]MBJ8919350.1 hypothetical protein [Citrobacter braakii]